MSRVALYARYSSDLQDDTSIEDQLRTCRKFVENSGWEVVEIYTDQAQSGASLLRRGIQNLMADAQAGHFDIIVAEAMDRLSRDQADIAMFHKHVSFADVKIVTLSEGEVNEMHIGLQGTMNQLFLKELKRKTHRGLEGRALKGKSAGGKSYGYDIVRQLDEAGTIEAGERQINEDEARVVRRIFDDYRKGKAPRRIASELNKEGIPGPSGKAWGASTIYGNRQRGTGILNNELYIGRQVWNKLRYVKDPHSGKRVSKLNPEDAWVIADVPHLRIIMQELWDEVKAYQGELDRKPSMQTKKRPQNLFSYLLKCGECGGGMSIVAPKRYGCSSARNKGTCGCRTTISQDALEERVLGALRARLMDSKMTRVFCDEYAKEVNRIRMEHNAERKKWERDLEKTKRQMDEVLEALYRGADIEFIKSTGGKLQAEHDRLTALLETTEEAPAYVHPNMGQRYAEAIVDLITSLNDPEHRAESATIIRSLISKIVLTPNDERTELIVDLHGDLAGILQMSEGAPSKGGLSERNKLERKHRKEIEQIETLSQNAKSGSKSRSDVGKVQMVAGVGFEPTTFRL
ncbi:recombinase family protein [Rhodobacterales bacterium HKCCE4037]|nr:recombinase family protein [Rhodobacterales bacterium HKCCE4037]